MQPHTILWLLGASEFTANLYCNCEYLDWEGAWFIVLSVCIFKKLWFSTVCQRNSDPFYSVNHYKKWATTSLTDSISFCFSFYLHFFFSVYFIFYFLRNFHKSGVYNLLDVPYISANIYCKSRNLPIVQCIFEQEDQTENFFCALSWSRVETLGIGHN